MLLVILKANEFLELFTKTNCKKTKKTKKNNPNQKEFRVEKVIRRQTTYKRKGYNSSFNSWIDKKDIVQISEHFREPKSSGWKVKVEFDLSNYAKKADIINAAGDDTSKFAKKVDLANLISNVDKLDIDKLKNVPSGLSSLKNKVDKLDIGTLETTPADLSKLSNVLKKWCFWKDWI